MEQGSKVGAAFVEVLTSGMNKVQSDLNRLAKVAEDASKPLVVDVVANVDPAIAATERVKKAFLSAASFAEQINKDIQTTPLSMALNLDKGRSRIVDDVNKQVQEIPKNVRIPFVADKIDVVKNQIRSLEDELQKLPDSRDIKLKLDFAKNLQADLEKTLGTLSISPRLDLADALKSATSFAGQLRQEIAQTPLSLALNLDKSRLSVLSEVKKEAESLPKEVRIAFVADKLQAVQTQIQALEAELARLPESKEVSLKLSYAKNLRSDLEKLASVTATISPKLDVTNALKSAGSFAAQLQQQISQSPVSLALNLDKSRLAILAEVKNELAALPHEVRIPFLADRIETVRGQIAALEAELQKLPSDTEVSVKLTFAQNLQADLQKQLANVNATITPKVALSEAYKSVGEFANNLQVQLAQSPISLAVQLDRGRQTLVSEIKKEVGELPKEVKIPFIADKIEIVRTQITALQAELQKLPNDKELQLKLEFAQNLKSDLDKQLAAVNATITPRLELSEAFRSAGAFAKNLQDQLSQSPLSLAINLDKSRLAILGDVQAELASMPREVRIQFIADKLQTVQGQIESLEQELAKLPESKELQLQVQFAKNVQSDLQKQLDAVDATITPKVQLSEALKATTSFAQQIKEQLSQTPLSLAVNIDKSRLAVINELKAEIESLPKDVRINFIGEKIEAVKGQVAALEAELAKMPDNKELQLKVQFAKNLQADLEKQLAVTVSPRLDLADALKSATSFARQLQEQLNSSPVALALQLDKTRSDFVNEVNKSLDGLPKEKKIAVVADKLAAVKAEIAALQEELKKTPNDKTIQLKLLYAKNLQADLQKQLANVKGPANFGQSIFAGLSGVTSSITSSMGRLTAALQNVSLTAAATFGVASAGMLGFAKAADPGRFMQLQAAMAALSVQIGSIFIPVLDSAVKGLQSVLEGFRSLSVEQKENLAGWAKFGLTALAVVAVVPKVIGAFSLLSGALSVLGGIFTVSTGGILLLVGAALAAVPAITALVGSLTGGNLGGAFSKVGESIGKLVSVTQDAFGRIAGAVSTAVEPLKPILFGLAQNLAEGFNQAVAFAAAGVGRIAGFFEQIAPRVQATFSVIAEGASRIFEAVGPKLSAAVSATVSAISSSLENLGRLVGPAVDVLGQVGAIIGENVVPVLVTFAETIAGIVSAIMPVVAQIGEAITPVIEGVIAGFSTLIEWLQPVFAACAELASTLMELLLPAFQLGATIISGAVQTLQSMFGWLVEAIRPIITIIGNVLKPAFQFLGTIIKGISDAIKSVVNTLIDFVNSLIDTINAWLPTALAKIDKYAEKETRKPNYYDERDERPEVGDRDEQRRLETYIGKLKEAKGGTLKDKYIREANLEVAENQLADVMKRTAQAAREAEAKKELAADDRARNEKTARMAPLLAPKPTLFGIQDAWRRAQQATQALTPEQALMNEQIRIAKDALKEQQKASGLLEDLKNQKAAPVPGIMGP